MFDLFKRKTSKDEPPTAAEVAPDAPSQGSAEKAAPSEPVAQALEETPASPDAESGPAARPASWRERLKAGLGLTDDFPAAEVAEPARLEPFAPETEAGSPAAPVASWRERLKAGLGLSRSKLAGALTGVFRRRVLDDVALEELESALLMADVGVDATAMLLEDMKARYRRGGEEADARSLLRDAMVGLTQPLQEPLIIGAQRPYVIMLTGVNGAGKTTSIGKLAKWLQQQGLSVLLAAGDTFRAAAREQLSVWGERNGVEVIQQSGGDPAAVMFDAVGAARARGIDVVLADTAGRLPTQGHLMEELRKIKRVLGKARDGAPDEVLLVLDANTGQNALAQVRAFDQAVGVTGLIVTKLDGSAKGGVVAAIARQHPIPLRFIGIGERVDDLRPFVASEFVEALLPDEVDAS